MNLGVGSAIRFGGVGVGIMAMAMGVFLMGLYVYVVTYMYQTCVALNLLLWREPY